MVMKDKLTKNNHKGSYYRKRRIGFFSIAFLSLGIAVSIPTYINTISSSTVKAERSADDSSFTLGRHVLKDVVEGITSFDKIDKIL